MNRKEMNEIRRRFNPERSTVSVITGCYVSKEKQIISSFSLAPQMAPEDEVEKYYKLFKKVLSGTQTKNLVDLEFSAEEVNTSDKHALLMKLRDSALTDTEAVEKLLNSIIETYPTDENYLILLMHDAYDVPSFSSDGTLNDDGADIFRYILCAVCPVKQNKPALKYCAEEGEFHTRNADYLVSAPNVGFMFPAFNDRKTDIYCAQCYYRDPAFTYDELIEDVLGGTRPMPSSEQAETFRALLEDSLEEECSYDIVQSIHEQLSERIKEQQTDKEAEPLRLSRSQVSAMLTDCGISADRIDTFAEEYDKQFGAGTDISAVNIVDPKAFSVRTGDVVIKIDPSRSDLITTKTIDGHRYILVPADGNVEVNGINIQISEEN